MEATSNTPFKLPLWSEWAVHVKGKEKKCSYCTSSISPLKELAIQSLFKYLKQINKYHEIPKILQDNFIPPVLYVDVACLLFASKQWCALRSLVAYWPFETFQLSQIIHVTCSQCWLAFLESDDFEDPEKEGGDTERQLFRKVFKHVLDGFFVVVKRTLENEGQVSPLRVLDLTLDTSQEIRSFMWEDEFRRLGRRITKILDVCILAGLHKKMRSCKKLAMKQKNSAASATRRSSNTWEANNDAIGYWQPEVENNSGAAAVDGATGTCESTFEISTWDEETPVMSATDPSVGSTGNKYDDAYWQEERFHRKLVYGMEMHWILAILLICHCLTSQ
ncbi:hypothetical protein DAPPUDRAFT_310467 [Daphnia pulex]|uniref:Uncharacterized protein n=1 Tax=Daphnia pulex TaxID=6669 RepID=E9FTR9_DAPPU|nr:hypothetical protein DAPPUDRAFT_310467 [Daphnia pulex]|eukprot:EFX89594.1 hypothetical protein DAPPUDRAFT_310467 [Daphnia pulex]